MIERDSTRDLFADAIDLLDDEQALLSLSGGSYAVCALHDKIVRTQTELRALRLGLFLGRRDDGAWQSAAATTENLGKEGLRSLVRQARASLCADPDYLEPLHESPRALAPSVDERTFEAGPAYRLDLLVENLLEARRAGLELVAELRTSYGGFALDAEHFPFALASSEGLFAFAPSSAWQLRLLVGDGAAPGWADVALFEGTRLEQAEGLDGLRFAAERGRSPRSTPEQPMLLLDAPATAALLEPLLDALSGEAVLAQRSPFSNKLGEAVLGSRWSLSCKPALPELALPAFDAEGATSEALDLVREGVLVGLGCGRRSAAALGRDPNGRARRPEHGLDGPRALALAGGEGSLEELATEAGRGVLVRALHAEAIDGLRLRCSAPYGGWAIVDGVIDGSLAPFEWICELDSLSRDTVAFGTARRALGMHVPPLLSSHFDVASLRSLA